MKLDRVLRSLALVFALAVAERPSAAQQAALQPVPPDAMLELWRTAPVVPLALDGVPSKGPEPAPVRIVEFGDYLCPPCRSLAKAWAAVLPTVNDRVAFSFKNYPLDLECNDRVSRTMHPGACWLALGGLCAAEQKRFWEYNELALSAVLNNPQAQDVVELAVQAGLERAAMESCLHASATMGRLKAEIEEAYAAGVRGTPNLFLDGKRLPDVGYLWVWLNAELQQKGLPPAPRQ
jgi:protein-disulfide isomerase